MTTEVRGPFAARRLRSIDDPRLQPPVDLPARVSGGYGSVPAASVDTTAAVPVPARLSTKDAQTLMQAELIQAVRSLADSTTEITARLGGRQGAVNGVLMVRLVALDGEGSWRHSGAVTVGSAVVENHHETDPLYVVSGESTTAPVVGAVGVRLIPAGQERRMPIGAHSLAIWGPAAALASVQLFTGLQPYGVASL